MNTATTPVHARCACWADTQRCATCQACEEERRKRRQLQARLAFARRHGIRADAAERFLARQAASLARQQRMQTTRLPQGVSQPIRAWVACCDAWFAVTSLPTICPQCGRSYLRERRTA